LPPLQQSKDFWLHSYYVFPSTHAHNKSSKFIDASLFSMVTFLFKIIRPTNKSQQ